MKDRLAKFLKNESLSSSRFAEIMDIPASNVSHLLSGRNKPGFDFIAKMILRFPKMNPDWLITGNGTMYRSSAPQPEEQRGVATDEADLFSGNRQQEFPVENHDASQIDETTDYPIVAKTADDNMADFNELSVHPQHSDATPASLNPANNSAVKTIKHKVQDIIVKPTDGRACDDEQDVDSIIVLFKDSTFRSYKQRKN